MKWDFKNGAPIYQQIVRALRKEIAGGGYPPGSRVPAVRELALEAGVNPNTMQRALAELERDGLLETVRTTGKYVTQDRECIGKMRRDLAAESISGLIGDLKSLGLSGEEILDEVKKSLMETGNSDEPVRAHEKKGDTGE